MQKTASRYHIPDVSHPWSSQTSGVPELQLLFSEFLFTISNDKIVPDLSNDVSGFRNNFDKNLFYHWTIVIKLQTLICLMQKNLSLDALADMRGFKLFLFLI